MATFSYDWVNRVVTLLKPDVRLDVQVAYNAWALESSQQSRGIVEPLICEAFGKDVLDVVEGTSVPIYVRLVNNWQFAFEARTVGEGWTECTVSGGGLIGGLAGNPIAVTDYVFVKNIVPVIGVRVPETAENLAAAVWNAPAADHLVPATMGKLLADLEAATIRIQALVHHNVVIDQTVYDGDDQLTDFRLRSYDSRANALAKGTTGLLATWLMTSAYRAPRQMNEMIQTEAP